MLGNDWILGAVGILQFDVIISRLKDEYAVDAIYAPVNLSAARWAHADDKALLERFQKDLYASLATDSEGNLALLVDSAWRLEYIMEQWPDITFHATREKN
jgi:peptide chain release factor 3